MRLPASLPKDQSTLIGQQLSSDYTMVRALGLRVGILDMTFSQKLLKGTLAKYTLSSLCTPHSEEPEGDVLMNLPQSLFQSFVPQLPAAFLGWVPVSLCPWFCLGTVGQTLSF